ncbi:MAG: ABC transporter ATP-binding protein [Thermodesulfobacteriota bacterium]|nr:ABC transporter ATP-binding protein [Thermodesulfobacteriota bacterium]
MINVQDVNIKVGSFFLNDINLHVRKGEYFVIVGPTGAGKSCILNCIAGLYKIDSGDLWVDGKRSNNVPIEERNIGYVFQDAFLFPHLNVYKNIAFGLRSRKDGSRDDVEKKISDICRLFGIYGFLDRSVYNLSGGEKQRVALARSMICEPKAILLDEPFSSVDRNTAEKLMIEFKKIHEQTGQTVVHVTHNQEEAMILADRICVMNNGILIQTGAPGEILRKPDSEFVADFFGAHNVFQGISVIESDFSRIECNGNHVYCREPRSGEIVFSVRPEEVVISLNDTRVQSRNNYSGTVKRIVDRGVIIQVFIDAGFPIVSYIFRNSLTNMGLREGDSVNIGFEESAVHII